MQLISFALTTPQIRNRSKTVTRRLGWRNLKPGTLLMACEKVMGRQGKPLVRLAVIVVTDVRQEPLSMVTDSDVVLEGFPKADRLQFVSMFCKSMVCLPSTEVTRIEFRYAPGARFGMESLCG